MKTTSRKQAQAGHSFIVAMIMLLVIAGMAALAVHTTSSSARLNARAADYAEGERVADSMIDYAFGVWKRGIQNKDGELSAADLTALNLTAPTIPNYTQMTNIPADPDRQLKITPVDCYGGVQTTPPRYYQYLDDFPGWRGFVYNYAASVKITATSGLSAGKYITGAKRTFQYIEVPLFQSMFFFENTLEIYRPAPMIVGGLVHTNRRLMVSGSSDQSGAELIFQGNVSYADSSPVAGSAGYTFTEPPLGGPAWAGLTAASAPGRMEQATFSNGGASAQLAKVGRYEPLGTKPAQVLNSADSNANNDSYREIIEPPVTGDTDPAPIAKRRLFNKAGIVIEINGSGSTPTVNVTAKNGTSLTSTQITSIRSAVTGKNTIYDQREGKNVDVANVDVSVLTPVLNAASGFNGVLYIHDVTPMSGSDPEPRTVRLRRGGVLPNAGLTVVSQNPVYVQGDYNTGTTTNPSAVPANSTGNPNNTDSPTVSGYSRKPAAICADAVMFLSNNWSDANSSSSLSSRQATNTTYNTAILAGFMPSGWQPPGGGAAYGYSGGANNYPRFLETWSGDACTYHGSMVQLFESRTFTGRWDTGNIYSPPQRRWNYDTLFNNNPPPGNVDAVVVTRGAWARLGAK